MLCFYLEPLQKLAMEEMIQNDSHSSIILFRFNIPEHRIKC